MKNLFGMMQEKERGAKVTHCGEDCWCFGSEKGRCKTEDIAKALGVSKEKTEQLIREYFTV